MYGRAFEHFLLNEVRARIACLDPDAPLTFWRRERVVEKSMVLGWL